MSHLIVKQRSFWHSRQGVAVIVLLALLLAWGVFELGRYRAGYDTLAVAGERSELNGQIAELERQLQEMRDQHAVLERSGQIESQAYKQLEGTVTGLQDEILELKEELAFYRGIVSPKDDAKGLKVQNFELRKVGKGRHYGYKVVLTQVLNDGSLVRGDLTLEVAGRIKGEQKALPLEELGEAGDGDETTFNFKYFQILEGDLVLPEGFEPSKVNLTVKPKGKTNNKLTQTFDWVVGE